MRPLYEKLNFLLSTLYPDYAPDTGFMRGKIVRLTIGDLFVRTPGILESLKLTVDDIRTSENSDSNAIISEEDRNKLWSLGEKGLIFEITQTRIYPHKNLFSHVLGQIDIDNNGISGIEKFYDTQIDPLPQDFSKLL